MPKKAGIVFVLMGAVLILSALLLLFYNRVQDANAGQASQSALESVQQVIEQASAAKSKDGTATENALAKGASAGLSIFTLGEDQYIGVLSIPALELELPVMAEWDYDKLKIAPCRQFGAVQTEDLVIAAHNYKKHFGYLYKLRAGDEVCFTQMDGTLSRYTVASVTTLTPDNVDAVQNSGYPLVLYTCTYRGVARVAVFCSKSAA